MKLKDKIAIVTGGGGGLGEGICLCLAREGAHVAVSDINLDLAEKTAAKVREKGIKSVAVKTDVSQEKDVRELFQTVSGELGDLDILVCCAGVSGVRDRALDKPGVLQIDDVTVKEWDNTFAVNMRGVFLCNRAGRAHFPGQEIRTDRKHFLCGRAEGR